MAEDAEDLQRLRQSVGLTRAEAAAHLGIEPHTLQQAEEGLELPPDPPAMARVVRREPGGPGCGDEAGWWVAGRTG